MKALADVVVDVDLVVVGDGDVRRGRLHLDDGFALRSLHSHARRPRRRRRRRQGQPHLDRHAASMLTFQ